jgi:hypothetical protein
MGITVAHPIAHPVALVLLVRMLQLLISENVSKYTTAAAWRADGGIQVSRVASYYFYIKLKH